MSALISSPVIATGNKEKDDTTPPESKQGVSNVQAITDFQNADDALEFLRSESSVQHMTPLDEKQLVRKIDWMIMPLMFCAYLLQYLDKTLINYANVMGIQHDTGMTPAEFSYMALVFYVTFLAFEFPHAYGMQRLPTARYLGSMVFLWGIVVTATCACKSYDALVATRVLLGCFESAVSPALVLITSMWYKRHEQPWRVGIWYSGVGFGAIVGSLTSFGLQHYHGRTFFNWQIVFLILGLVTCVIGILIFFLVPNNPMTSRLTLTEKLWAIERVRENQTGIENKRIKPHQIRACLLDPQTWLLSLICITSTIPNGSVSTFQVSIIKEFGFTPKTATLLQIPAGIIIICAILSCTYLAGRFNQRGIQIVAWVTPGILGGALMVFLPSSMRGGKLAGVYLTNTIGTSLALLFSWTAANNAGHTKKVTMNAVLLVSCAAGNIIGPLTFTGASAPGYVPAKATIIAACVAAVLLSLVLHCYYSWENRRRDRAAARGEVVYLPDVEFADWTDRENKMFRYRL